MALVEPPVALHRQPHHVHCLEGKVAGEHGTGLQRGVSNVERESFGRHGDSSGGRFGAALLGEVDIVPPGEEVEFVPFALPMAKNHKRASHVGQRSPDHADVDDR